MSKRPQSVFSSHPATQGDEVDHHEVCEVLLTRRTYRRTKTFTIRFLKEISVYTAKEKSCTTKSKPE
jgi:hypothetical protein